MGGSSTVREQLRVALAWDLGAGHGHAVRLTALAEHIEACGHVPVLLSRDLRTLRGVSGGRWPLLGAPHNSWFPASPAPASWTDILWIEAGLHDRRQAEAITLAWRDQLRELRIDRVIADGAPLVPLAARALGIPCLRIGNGFTLPPGPPWPIFRDWEPVDSARVDQREAAIIDTLNTIGASIGVNDACAALTGDAEAVFTWPPFDHYAHRQQGVHVGALRGRGAPPAWPAGAKRVFVYLQPGYPHLALLESALRQRSDLAVLAYFGGARPWADSTSMRTSDVALDITELCRHCDMVISHGGNLAALATASGCPSLLLPTQAEMYLTARRLVERGSALAVTPPYDPLDFATPIDRLLREPAFKRTAIALAAQLEIGSDWQTVEAACALIL
jgi:UDP:flavonoid glycosyltransferase YjiC (YdhE family)